MIFAIVAAVTICGALHQVGSAGDAYNVIEPSQGDASVAYLVTPKLAQQLSTWNGYVCLTGPVRSTLTPGVSGEIDVRSYRLVGDGHHGPIVGKVARANGRWTIATDDRKRFPVCQQSRLTSYQNRHVWLLARWQDCGMDATAIGDLDSN